jgi:hypothetical protein
VKDIPYIMQDNGITIFIDKTPHHVSATSPKFKRVKKALKQKDWDKIESLISYGTAIKTFSQGKMKLDKGEVTYDGNVLPATLSSRIIKLVDEEMDLGPLISFVERLKANPSFNSAQQTYAFLETNMLPITEDGFVLAYKTVTFAQETNKELGLKRGDLVDSYTRTNRNNIGDVVEMERNEVNDDPNITCSFGLHGGSEAYYSELRHRIGSVMLVIKVDPKDFVAVPKHHHHGKFRCCRYEVISYYGNDGDKKLEDKGVISATQEVDAFDTKVDTKAQVQKSLNIVKSMILSYTRQRLSQQAGHKAAVAGYVGYLQGVTLKDEFTVLQIAKKVQDETGFMSVELKGQSLYIVRA